MVDKKIIDSITGHEYSKVAITICVMTDSAITHVVPIEYATAHCLILKDTTHKFNLFNIGISTVLPIGRIRAFNQYHKYMFVMFWPFFDNRDEKQQLRNIKAIFEYKRKKSLSKLMFQMATELDFYRQQYSDSLKSNIRVLEQIKLADSHLNQPKVIKLV